MKIDKIPKHLRYLAGKGIGLPDKIKLHTRKRYEPFQLKFFNKKIDVPDSGSFLGVYQELFIDKIYQFKPSSSSPLIIDCGANIGLSVIFFKKHFPAAKIIAYEADPEIFKTLQHNVDTFDFSNVELVDKAVWTNNDYIEFEVEGGASGMIKEGGSDSGNTVKIPTIRLHDVLKQHATIDFLKIDIEGAEFEVIKDCAGVIDRAKHIFIEYHSMENKEQSLGELLDILKAAGFRYHITEAFTSKHPFISRPLMTGMDLLLNIYAYK